MTENEAKILIENKQELKLIELGEMKINAELNVIVPYHKQ